MAFCKGNATFAKEIFFLRNTQEQKVLPLTILTDNVGVVQGLDRRMDN